MGSPWSSSRSIIALAFGIVVPLVLLAAPTAATATNVSDFTVAPAIGGTALPLSGGWRTLAGPMIEIGMYSNPDVFPTGLTVSVILPAGFAWDPTVVEPPTVAIAAGMPAGFCTLVASGLAYPAEAAPHSVSYTLSGTHDVGCTVSLTGLRVRWVGDGAAARSGAISVLWTIPGVGTGRASGGRVASIDFGGSSALPATDTAEGAPVADGANPFDGRGLGHEAGLLVGLFAVLLGGFLLLTPRLVGARARRG